MAHQLSALPAKTESLTQPVYQVFRDLSRVQKPLLLTHRPGFIDADGARIIPYPMQFPLLGRAKASAATPSELAVSSHASVA